MLKEIRVIVLVRERREHVERGKRERECERGREREILVVTGFS